MSCLINITEGFRQYISDHLLLQWVSFQLAAPHLHNSRKNEKEFFNIILRRGCAWLTGMDGASVGAVAIP